MKEEKHIPVETAKQISDNFDKPVVIILAYDKDYKRLFRATFGKRAEDKCFAANVGDYIAEALGYCFRGLMVEDFREIEAAKAKEENDRLKELIKELIKVGDFPGDDGDVWAVLEKAHKLLDE